MSKQLFVRSLLALSISSIFSYSGVASAQLMDSDSDGMPDDWENFYALDSFNSIDANEDADLDGLSNFNEYIAKTNPKNPDSDFDSFQDGVDIEPTDPLVAEDSDNDGLPNGWEIRFNLDPNFSSDASNDFDFDGLTALQEYQANTYPTRQDSDGDGVIDGQDIRPADPLYHTDSDGDGLPDAYENAYAFLDPYFLPDATDDFDSDQVSNRVEFDQDTNPALPDTDGDGVWDSDDLYPTNAEYAFDTDFDGLPDAWEQQIFSDAFRPNWWEDFDGDELHNLAEFEKSTDPQNTDSDGDWVYDGHDQYPLDSRYMRDDDKDGMPSEFEWLFGFSDLMALDGGMDLDGDQLSNSFEFILGTSPDNPDSDYDGVMDGEDLWPTDRTKALDTDADGLPDSWEVINGFDWMTPFDAVSDDDFDDLTVLDEYRLGTDPRKQDTDGDGVWDGEDVAPLNNAYSLDNDNDGLPVEYEEVFYFLDDFNPIDGSDDWDGDQLTNRQEFELGTNPDAPDTDNDGFADDDDYRPLDPQIREQFEYDEDGDGIPNQYEWDNGLDAFRDDGEEDLDGDRFSNLHEYLLGADPNNPDSDDDGAYDGDEHFPLDSRYRWDMDRDGMPEQYEMLNGTNDWDTYDGADDPDYDGLNNSQEYFAGTDPHHPDTDLDGVNDGEDLWPTDRTKALDDDHDGLPNAWEIINGFDPLNSFDAQQDFDEFDGSSDGLTLLGEYLAGTDWRKVDTDGDGVWDGEDVAPLNKNYSLDNDNDGLPVEYEEQYFFLNDFNSFDATEDWDGDQLTNLQEFELGTNPDAPDTDNDGFYDGDDYRPRDSLVREQFEYDEDGDGIPNQYEWDNGLDAWRDDGWEDIDGDRLSNLQEYLLGTDPNNPDSDDDGAYDGDEHFPLDARYRWDMDRDGMPEQYEMLNGTNDWNTYDGAEDPDYDQLNNSQEFFAGTKPNLNDTDFDGVVDGEDFWPLSPTKALDSDNDGMADAWEVLDGLDPNFPNDALDDLDSDGATNLEEFISGTDINSPDTDLDGVNDGEDHYPLSALYALDSDGDGIADEYENAHPFALSPLNGEDANLDFDFDFLTNAEEFVLGTNPELIDTDGDGFSDSDDFYPLDGDPITGVAFDHDQDGLPENWEYENGLSDYNPSDAHEDFDRDQLTNIEEFKLGSDPLDQDTDGDGWPDSQDRYVLNSLYHQDWDRDTLPDVWETFYGLNPSNTYDALLDPDNDGLNNIEEFKTGGDPFGPGVADSDGDGIGDFDEIANGLNPSDPSDATEDWDGDLLNNREEIAAGTDLNSWDSDFDGLPDGFEVQYGFNPVVDSGESHQDSDGDGLTNFVEWSVGTDPTKADTDGDLVADGDDEFPFDSNEWADTDGDGVGDNADAFPNDATEVADNDNDGIGDVADTDDDNDQMPDAWELANNFDPLSAIDAAQDVDEDRYTNLREFELASDPNDVASPGSPFLQSGVIQSVSSSSWTTVALDHEYASMVVVAAPVYDLPQAPMVVRVRNAVSNTFEMKLDRADGNSTEANADVHFTVVEEGDYQLATHGITMEAVKYLSTVTDRKGRWTGEAALYINSYVQPVLVGQVMSANDPDFSVFWSRGSSVKNSASATDLFVGKNIAEDPDTTRADETIGYIVMEEGSGEINGYLYEAAMGADVVDGLNGNGYDYSLQTITDVTAAVASQSGMDGGNGGWAVLRQTPGAGILPVAIDEDQLKDNERSHTSEEVSYIVFGQE